MVNFEVNDIIRSSFISDHTLNQINDANYGIILAITTESVSIKWVMDDNSNVNTKYSSKNLENFDIPDENKKENVPDKFILSFIRGRSLVIDTLFNWAIP